MAALIGKVGDDVSLARRKRLSTVFIFCFAVVILCLAIVPLNGCKGYDVLQSTSIRSPDGQWVAETVTKRYGGFGSAGIQSEVNLRREKGPNESLPILQLSQDEANVHLKVQWTSASQLDISYAGRAEVDFQAIRCGGISITVAPSQGNGG